jgi:diketogulonate reductase-like aldo/keto reductase
VLTGPVVIQRAAQSGVTPPQVALQWLLQLAPNVLLIPGPAPPVTGWTTLPSSTWR